MSQDPEPPFEVRVAAEKVVAEMLDAYLMGDAAYRAANDVIAKLFLGGFDVVRRSALLPVGDDTPSLRGAIEPFAQAAANEASRVHLEDSYFTGPSGLTVGDWRQLAAAIADYDAAATPRRTDS